VHGVAYPGGRPGISSPQHARGIRHGGLKPELFTSDLHPAKRGNKHENDRGQNGGKLGGDAAPVTPAALAPFGPRQFSRQH